MEFARRDFQTLSRIMTTLIALAALAERAGGMVFPVRWVVLAILRQAEAVAAGFVAETLPAAWPCVEQSVEPGSDPADAMWLAWRFRMLAAALGALLSCDFDRFRTEPAPRRFARHPRRPMTSNCLSRRPDDTS